MPRIGSRVIKSIAYVMFCVGFVLSGCASQPTGLPSGAGNDPATVDIADTQPLETLSVSPLSRQPWDFELPGVAIILTNSRPAYADVAVELAQRLERYTVYDLGDESTSPTSILRNVNDSNSDVVVAIGLPAAQSSVELSTKPVIFSQVFNHQDYNLLTDSSRGVAAIPPLDAQLAAWKKIDPTVVNVGLIIGEGHDDLIEEARLAAAKHEIDLRVQVTTSDQETLYFFRRMVHDIDGFWLFPDNRVLSGRVLQEMLADAKRQQVPVTVPSNSMLELGATMSMTTVAADIAQTIVKVIREIKAGNLDSLPPITQLSEIRVETNGAIQVVDR
jgi:ABC-type uncharacterized transport system substrate-binding protein